MTHMESLFPEVPTPARTVSLTVHGLPRPQGSLRAHQTPGGKVAMRYSSEVYKWRAQVQQAIEELNTASFTGPVELRLGFTMPRLASHYMPVNSKRSEPLLRANAPVFPTVAPDLDKLVRCVNDAITDAGLWRDDAQVAVIVAAKCYGDLPGVHIEVTELKGMDHDASRSDPCSRTGRRVHGR